MDGSMDSLSSSMSGRVTPLFAAVTTRDSVLSAYVRRLLSVEGSVDDGDRRYALRPDLLAEQREVSFAGRQAVVDWMNITAEGLFLRCTSVSCAVALLDCYLSVTPHVSNATLQPLGAAALLVASKLHEAQPIGMGYIIDCVHPLPLLPDGTEAERDPAELESLQARYRQLEWSLCSALEWAITPPTVVEWIELLARQLGMLADAAAEKAKQSSGSSSSSSSSPPPRPTHRVGQGEEPGCLSVAVDKDTFVALLCCTSGVHGAENPQQVGEPMVVWQPPALPASVAHGPWPCRLSTSSPSGRAELGLPSSRCPSKMLADLNSVASAVALHAGHSAFPPSVLACAILACLVHEYSVEAGHERDAAVASLREQGDEYNSDDEEADDPITGDTEIAVLSRLACLRPVVWQLIGAFLPGAPTQPRQQAGAEAHGNSMPSRMLGAAGLLSPPMQAGRKRPRHEDDAVTRANAPTPIGPVQAASAGDHASSPWGMLPAAIGWVHRLMVGMPPRGAHYDALAFLTDPEFDRDVGGPAVPSILPYITVHTRDLKGHVMAAATRQEEEGAGARDKDVAWALSTFPELRSHAEASSGSSSSYDTVTGRDTFGSSSEAASEGPLSMAMHSHSQSDLDTTLPCSSQGVSEDGTGAGQGSSSQPFRQGEQGGGTRPSIHGTGSGGTIKVQYGALADARPAKIAKLGPVLPRLGEDNRVTRPAVPMPSRVPSARPAFMESMPQPTGSTGSRHSAGEARREGQGMAMGTGAGSKRAQQMLSMAGVAGHGPSAQPRLVPSAASPGGPMRASEQTQARTTSPARYQRTCMAYGRFPLHRSMAMDRLRTPRSKVAWARCHCVGRDRDTHSWSGCLQQPLDRAEPFMPHAQAQQQLPRLARCTIFGLSHWPSALPPPSEHAAVVVVLSAL